MFYIVLTITSENVRTDTSYSLGIGLTAFAGIWYFRNELFASANSVIFKLIFPLLGGQGLLAVFVRNMDEHWPSWDHTPRRQR